MRYDIDFLFCVIDDFCKMYEEWERHRFIPNSGMRRRCGVMSMSDLMTIMVLFHVSPCKNFKWVYLAYLPLKHGKDFPNRVSYTRFVVLQSRYFCHFNSCCIACVARNLLAALVAYTAKTNKPALKNLSLIQN